MNVRLKVSIVLCLALSAAPVLAQAPPPAFERRTVINLDEDVIEASPKRPEGVTVGARKRPTPHKSLIRMRSDFRHEVLSSIASL